MNNLFKLILIGTTLLPTAFASSSQSITKKINAKSKSEVSGKLTIIKAGADVLIKGQLKGFDPNSKFGFHVHEKGDCSSEDAKSAGEHFAPDGHKHGSPKDKNRHKGDLGNLSSNSEGVVLVNTKVLNSNLEESGEASILNRALVIHAQADDFKSQPSGDSGKRIACLEIR